MSFVLPSPILLSLHKSNHHFYQQISQYSVIISSLTINNLDKLGYPNTMGSITQISNKDMGDDVRSQFIVDENIGQQNVEALAKRALQFGRVTRTGGVVIDVQGLTKGDQLKLILVIRYIANRLDESISRTVRPTELVSTLGQRMEAVGAGLSKLNADGFAKREDVGEYSVHSYKVESFLSDLEELCARVIPSNEKISSRKRRRTTGRSTGIGADIRRLVEEGFFDTPKFVSEVSQKLRQENAFHDDRVIDNTLRNSYMSNKRVLKRIPNEGSGKAKWRYVIRK